jgi:hypothetical protein
MKPAPRKSVKPAVKPAPQSQLANVSTASATSTTPMAAAAASQGNMRDFQKVAARKYIAYYFFRAGRVTQSPLF